MRRLALAAIAVATITIAFGFAGSASARSAGVVSTPCVASGEAAQQQAVQHAGLVVVFPDRVETRCIEFAGDSITGTDLLEQSGLTIVFAGFGGLGGGVCRIEDVGCSDPGNCFCQCHGADCAYWSYFALEDGAWTYENLGPAQHRLRDGDVDGWVWGSGDDVPVDARGPCPATPTPTVVSVALDSTPAASSGTQIAPPRATEPPATSTPSPETTAEVRAQQTPRELGARSNASSAKTPGGGVPVGLIAFGVVAGVLILGTGGVLVWSRRRG